MAQLEESSQQSQASGTSRPYQSGGGQNSAQSGENPKPEVRINSDEIGAAIAQSLGNAGTGGLSPDSNISSGSPTIKDQQVSLDGDVVHGQFLTEIAGKDVWVTVSGHIGEKDGYATFDPTEFKVGDLNVPVALVNPALQKKLGEQRDRLKLPDSVGRFQISDCRLDRPSQI